MRMVRGRDALSTIDPGGLEPLSAASGEFRAALVRENHTLKRALTDPHLFSGIGNAYSDEILHAAGLSPLKLTRSLTTEECVRLYEATRATLHAWIDRLREQTGDGFPEKVTAFRPEIAVHGQLQTAVSSVRGAGATNCLCGQRRVQLLRALSDRRAAPGGSVPVTVVERRLAAKP